MTYSQISDPQVLADYQAVLTPAATIAGPAADALRAGTLGPEAVDRLATNFLKTARAETQITGCSPARCSGSGGRHTHPDENIIPC